MQYYFDVQATIMMDSPWVELSVIIPVRFSQGRDIIERLDFFLQDKLLLASENRINFIVVDDGSSTEGQKIIKEKTKQLDIDYLYVDSQKQPFSIGRARNIGAMYARSTYVMFMDVDLMPYDGFYRDLLMEIDIQNLYKYANDFIMISVIYLTKKGGQCFLRQDSSIRKNTAINWLLLDDKKYIDKFSTGTSVCLYNRVVYLMSGGNDEQFDEWGYEDLEFNLRMIRKSKKFHFPQSICQDYNNFRSIVEYKGWKSIYRLFGDMTFQKGIVLFHMWHEVNEQSTYMQTGRKRNQKLFQERCESYHTKKFELPPLPDPYEGRTLVFSKTNPFVCNRNILPQLGIIHFQEEELFTVASLLKYIQAHHIDRILFHNPYATEHRLELYKAIKANNLPYIVAERGALRDSVFFDCNGFNAESTSYDSRNWDYELSKADVKLVEDYISNEKKLSISLEEQVSRKTLSVLYAELNIPLDKKILFVPLQRPSDTVIKYFCGDLNNYDNFIKLVQHVVENVSPDWVVVAKKHPLEDECQEINGVIFSNANIKDLIEISDQILLINSGVGVLSLLWGKSVMYAGEVFYGDERINNKVRTYQEVLTILESNFKPNQEMVYRFLFFLITKFYSFGKFKTVERTWDETGRMTVTKEIDFYQIRKIGSSDLNFHIDILPRINQSSILFDRYRKSGFSTNNDVALSSVGQRFSSYSLMQRSGFFLFGVMARPFMDKKKAIKLRQSPQSFFKDSKSSFTRGVGALLGVKV